MVPTSSISANIFESQRNTRSDTRDTLIQFVNNISISDIHSARAQISMLSVLTREPDEVTRQSGDSVTNQCIRLALALKEFSTRKSRQDLEQLFVGLASTMGNINAGLSYFLNARDGTLRADFSSATTLPEYYDTDVENFWTDPDNFRSDTQSGVDSNKNTLRQKYEVADKNEKSTSILDLGTSMLTQHFFTNESCSIQTPALSMTIAKLAPADIPSLVNLQSGRFTLPQLSELNSQSTPIIAKSQSEPMASNGHNSDNETFVGFSSAIDLTFYGVDGTRIPIENATTRPVDMWIARDPRLGNASSFQYVNATNLTVSATLQFLPNSFTVKSNNASIHIHIKPVNANVGYLLLVKLGYTPIVNATYADYDFMKLMCPQSSKKVIFVYLLY